MKIVSYIIIVCLSTVAFVSGCRTQGRAGADNGLVFDSLKLVKAYHLENDSTKPSCNLRVSFVFPDKGLSDKSLNALRSKFIATVFAQEYADSVPQAAANAYVRDYIKAYQDDAKLFYADVKTAEDIEDTKDFYSYYEVLSDKIIYNENNLLSYQVQHLNYKGGASSFTSYRNYVVDLKTGDFLTEDAIFHGGYEKPLHKLFIDKLLQQNNAKDVSELEDLGYFGIDDIGPNHNFLIDGDGITYIFNKGESSALSLSEIRLKFHYKELAGLLKPDSPIRPLIKE